jgi:2,3-diketo-5-methylthiopentyl-1-phosphate enolase
VDIALPLDLCSAAEGVEQLILLMTSGAEYNYADEFWVESIELPRKFVDRFHGPRYGIEGMRQLFPGTSRPLLGLIVKPRSGIPLEDLKRPYHDALIGGVDFLVDDLLMVDPDGEMCFSRRVPAMADLVHSAAAETKSNKHYFVNVASGPRRASHYIAQAVEYGASAAMVNAFTMGFGAVQQLIDDTDGQIPFIATNMGVGMITRPRLAGEPGKPTGMSEAVVSKLSRLVGVDAVHTGTSAAECYGEDAWGTATRALNAGLFGLKPCFAVAEGDLTIGNIWDNIASLGVDVLMEPTSGILNFPGGPRRGASAFRLLLDELNPGMTPQEAHQTIQRVAERHREVEDGLRFFGYSPV